MPTTKLKLLLITHSNGMLSLIYNLTNYHLQTVTDSIKWFFDLYISLWYTAKLSISVLNVCLSKVIVDYLCINRKCSPWDCLNNLRENWVFKVLLRIAKYVLVPNKNYRWNFSHDKKSFKEFKDFFLFKDSCFFCVTGFQKIPSSFDINQCSLKET